MLLVNCGIDYYIWRVLKSRLNNRFWPKLQLVSSVAFLLAMLVFVFLPKRQGDDGGFLVLMWSLYAYLSIYVSKLIFVVFDLTAKVPCLWKRKRCRAISYTGTTLALICFAAMWWGALVNRYRIDVQNVEFASPQIPQSFDGFRIAQISDIHTGSYGEDDSFLKEMVEKVNSLHPDMIVFTGDIVNRHSQELQPFVHTLSGLDAPYGVWSILGNHDYGDYYDWTSEQDKLQDIENLCRMQSRMGWHLLRNTHADIVKDADTLKLIGVENLGDPPFRNYGDLAASYPDLSDAKFKILLSHNPAHWTADIKGNENINIPLTLSGHTHAMQMSIGHSISPAAFRYDTWGGMYADSVGHNLYVNIGMGEVGIPARIGATPEITIITLRHSK